MRKMFFLVLAAAALLLMVSAQNVQAQSEAPRVEFGVHYSRLRLRDFDATDHGVGTRLTMNITDGLSVEGEFNFFPRGRDNLAAPTGFSGVSQRSQGLLIAFLWPNQKLTASTSQAEVQLSAPVRISDDNGDDEDPSVMLARDGRFYVAWSSKRQDGVNIYIKSSADGQTWSTEELVTIGPGEDYYPSLAQTRDGTFHIAWFRLERAQEDIDIWYSRCRMREPGQSRYKSPIVRKWNGRPASSRIRATLYTSSGLQVRLAIGSCTNPGLMMAASGGLPRGRSRRALRRTISLI